MATNKSAKKKKITDLHNNIDNTASVKKILDDLPPKNMQAYHFYNQLLRQRITKEQHHHLQNYHFVLPGHPINSFSEDWDGELNIDYFERFPYKSLAPKIVTTIRNIDKSDPVTHYMKSKLEWAHVNDGLRNSALILNVIDQFETLNEEVVRCPKHLVDMAAHEDTKPFPYFDSTFNWHYTGNGNLQLVCIDWIDYLLHSEFNCVHLSQLNKTDITIRPDAAAIFECDKDGNILETISCNNIVVLRTLNKVYILRLVTSNDEIQFDKLKVIGSELPYTSVSFDDHHKNILYITTLNYKLSIINLDRMKARSVKLNAKLTTLVNNYHSVIGTGRETYTHVTKRSISLYDKRVNNTIHEWKGIKDVADEMECNDISVAKHFEDTPYLYFATDHHLFLMDLRFRHNSKLKVVQRWTHGMEVIPTYISYCNFEFNKDLICLSSQWCEDMCVIPNYNDRFIKDTESGGVTIPYRPPSILKTLNEAREKMLCLDLYNPIDVRLRTAITGTLIIEQGEKYDVLLQNSLGDISCHTIFPEHLETFIEDDSSQCLHEWSQNYKLDRTEYEMSSVENIAMVLNKLKKVSPDYKIEMGMIQASSKFNEKEINDAFENEEIDCGLQEIWIKSGEQPTADQSSLAINLYYSDDEN